MFFFGGIFSLLVLGLIVALLATTIRCVIQEARLGRMVLVPPTCGSCGYGVTVDMMARARCPECGALYTVAGIEASGLRSKRLLGDKQLYVCLVIVALVTGIITSQVLSRPLSQAGLSFGDDGLLDLAIFFVTALLVGVPPIVWIIRRRQRLSRQLRERMMEGANAPTLAPPSTS